MININIKNSYSVLQNNKSINFLFKYSCYKNKTKNNYDYDNLAYNPSYHLALKNNPRVWLAAIPQPWIPSYCILILKDKDSKARIG
jgi:hypothetical protein